MKLVSYIIELIHVILYGIVGKPMFANGQRYVFVADFGARHCQATMKFEASHSR